MLYLPRKELNTGDDLAFRKEDNERSEGRYPVISISLSSAALTFVLLRHCNHSCYSRYQCGRHFGALGSLVLGEQSHRHRELFPQATAQLSSITSIVDRDPVIGMPWKMRKMNLTDSWKSMFGTRRSQSNVRKSGVASVGALTDLPARYAG